VRAAGKRPAMPTMAMLPGSNSCMGSLISSSRS